MNALRPSELDRRIERGEKPFILDIRPSKVYRTGSIAPSHNIPVYERLRKGDDEPLRERMDELPSTDEIVVVCKQGIVAKRATRLLNDNGYDAVTLAGGMGGWNGYQNGTLGYKLRSLLWWVRR